jgi:SAM-dependent methyltransferase
MNPGSESLRTIPCPLCGAEKFRRLWPGDIPFVRCGDCGLTYQNPQPHQDDLSRRYDSDYFSYERENEEAFFTLMRLGLQDVGFDELVKGLPPSFMDVGCATGLLLEEMKSRGFREQGVEICAPAAEFGRRARMVSIYTGTLEEAAFGDESFGVIHCSHLIEHLTDPVSFVREVRRLLVPGGLFLVTTPDILGFQSLLFRERWRSAIHDHMVLFSRRSLKRVLEEAGFRVLKRRSWGGLARGSAPAPLKAAADRICKILNQGDVMIMAARRS